MREVKDSGVEWLEKIPTDWNIIRMTKWFKFFKGLDIKKTDLVQYGSAVISYGQVHDKLNNGYSFQKNLIRYINQSMLETKEKSRLSNGDFVFADTSEDLDGVGNCIYIDSDSELYAGYHTLVARCIEPDVCHKYLAFLFLTEAWRSQLRRNANGTKVYSVTQRMFKFVSCLLPPIDIQLKIVGYLELKCNDIDTIIAKEQSVIEKLQEYKESIINEAVTKGVDIQVKFKPSGYDFIGDIPKSWKLLKVRYLGLLQNGISKSGNYFGHGMPFISYKDVNSSFDIPNQLDGLIESTKEEQEKYSVQSGDIFFTRTSETIDEIGISSVCKKTILYATFSGFLIRLRLINNIVSPDWAKYYFRSNHLRAYFVKEMNLVTRASLSQELLKSLPVLIPSQEEQNKIIKYLDEKCNTIDSIIIKKQALIDKLIEYKKSLIYEVVTGKKEVPHV